LLDTAVSAPAVAAPPPTTPNSSTAPIQRLLLDTTLPLATVDSAEIQHPAAAELR
jgi:hypothetical protein